MIPCVIRAQITIENIIIDPNPVITWTNKTAYNKVTLGLKAYSSSNIESVTWSNLILGKHDFSVITSTSNWTNNYYVTNTPSTYTLTIIAKTANNTNATNAILTIETNYAPDAIIIDDKITVQRGKLITLDFSASSDPNGTNSTPIISATWTNFGGCLYTTNYFWEYTRKTNVTDTIQIGANNTGTNRFGLKVSDGLLSSVSWTTLTVIIIPSTYGSVLDKTYVFPYIADKCSHISFYNIPVNTDIAIFTVNGIKLNANIEGIYSTEPVWHISCDTGRGIYIIVFKKDKERKYNKIYIR